MLLTTLFSILLSITTVTATPAPNDLLPRDSQGFYVKSNDPDTLNALNKGTCWSIPDDKDSIETLEVLSGYRCQFFGDVPCEPNQLKLDETGPWGPNSSFQGVVGAYTCGSVDDFDNQGHLTTKRT